MIDITRHLGDTKQTLGLHAPAYCTVTKWNAEDKPGRTSCDDMHCCRGSSTSVNEESVRKVHKFAMDRRRLTVSFMVESVSISTDSVHSIFSKNVLMTKLSVRSMPRIVVWRSEGRSAWYDAFALRIQIDDFISRFLIVDETAFIALIRKAKCKVWPGNMQFLRR